MDTSRFEAELQRTLAEVYRDRRWICAGPHPGPVRMIADQVLLAGGLEPHNRSRADEVQAAVLALAAIGVDPNPDSAVTLLDLELPDSGDYLSNVRATERLLTDLPPGPTAVIERWDPDGSARAIVIPVMGQGRVAGRPTFGARPSSWAELEDKLSVVTLFDAAGVTLAPCELVDLDDSGAVAAAHGRLASARGTVWAVDNKQGFHGGAAGTFRLPADNDPRTLAQRLRRDHDRVRIMPFIDGVPCSMHGLVLDDDVVVMRPTEMFTFIRPSTGGFLYAHSANFWDPTPGQRAGMAGSVDAVGRRLRSTVGYRGCFTIDGIMTEAGFRPTEVNPRYGIGLPMQLPLSCEPDATINLYLLHLAVVEGVIDLDAARFADWVVTTLDANRQGTCLLPTTRRPDEEQVARIRTRRPLPPGRALGFDDHLLDFDESSDGTGSAPAGEPALATVTWQADGEGGLLRIRLERAPIGPPTAPLIVSTVALVETSWQVGAPDIVAAATLDAG